jgi:hypothetical protein
MAGLEQFFVIGVTAFAFIALVKLGAAFLPLGPVGDLAAFV